MTSRCNSAMKALKRPAGLAFTVWRRRGGATRILAHPRSSELERQKRRLFQERETVWLRRRLVCSLKSS